MNTSAPRRPCRKPGCSKLSEGGYCPEHLRKRDLDTKTKARNYDNLRGTRTERGYDNRWLKAAAVFKKENPLCVICEKEGVYTPVYCVDHIVPHKGDMELFWDKSNWQSCCKTCHDRKTAKEDGGFGNEGYLNERRPLGYL